MSKFPPLDDVIPTGRHCELCNLAETNHRALIDFYLDRDPTNAKEQNLARVCAPCYRHLNLAMPDGIDQSITLFAFLINRGLYKLSRMTDKAGRVVNDPI